MKTIKRQLNQLEQRKRTIRQASYFRGFYEVNGATLTPEEFNPATYYITAYVNRGEAPEHLLNRKNVIFLDEQDYNL